MVSKGWMRLLLVAALSVSASLPAYADCVMPQAPSKIPDGNTASPQEMLTAMQTLQEYNNDVETYNNCLAFEVRQNQLSRADEARMHNNALEQLQKIATRFNEQVRTFKAKSG